MRTTTIGILAVGALSAAGCGGGATFANNPRPPTPVDLTVYINNSRVSVSPNAAGAGPIIFIVTNAASQTETLSIEPAATGSQPLANTGPISLQATADVTVNFQPGDYTVSTGSQAATDAALATASSIRPASLHIGPPRPSASNALLQP